MEPRVRQACAALSTTFRHAQTPGLVRLDAHVGVMHNREGLTLYPRVTPAVWRAIASSPEGGYAIECLNLLRNLVGPLWDGANDGRWRFTTSEALACATEDHAVLISFGFHPEYNYLMVPEASLNLANEQLQRVMEAETDPEAVMRFLSQLHPWAEHMLTFPWFNATVDKHWITIVPLPDDRVSEQDVIVSLRAASLGWSRLQGVDEATLSIEAQWLIGALTAAQPLAELT